MRLHLTQDVHVHTYYSHGTASVEEMVAAAVNAGLSEVHITEHGYAHYYARKIDRNVYLKMRDEINAASEKYPNIKVVFGVEANIFSSQGDIDIRDTDLELFDEINVGFHVLCKMKNLRSYFLLHVLPFLAYRCKIKGLVPKSVKVCTETLLAALRRYPIHMITHPMSNYPFELRKVAAVCAETGTILEINNARGKLDAQEVLSILDLPVKFAVGSDAHCPADVGKHALAFAIIEESGLDPSRVVNVVDLDQEK